MDGSADTKALLSHLVGTHSRGDTTPLHLIGHLRENGIGPTALADRFDIGKPTVYRMLDPLLDTRAVEQDEGKFTLTGFGHVLHHQITRHTTEFSIELADVAFVLDSAHRGWLLRQLHDGFSRKADIARTDRSPSRATIHRNMQAFEARDWLTSTSSDGQYSLTAEGARFLTGYDALVTAIGRVQSRAPLLRCCDSMVTEIPIEPLAEGDQIIYDSTTPDRFYAALEDLVEQGIDSIRVLQSFVSIQLADIFDPVVRSNVPIEFIMTSRVLRNLPTTGRYSENVRRGLQSRNVTIRVVPDTTVFPIALAVLNEETVAIGPPVPGQIPPIDDVPTGACVIASGSDLVSWADEIYYDYQAQSHTPIKYITNEILARILPSAQ